LNFGVFIRVSVSFQKCSEDKKYPILILHFWNCSVTVKSFKTGEMGRAGTAHGNTDWKMAREENNCET
jgi:hypothetical protein